MSESEYSEIIEIWTINETLKITCYKKHAEIEIKEQPHGESKIGTAKIQMTRSELVELGRRILTLWQLPIDDDHPDFPDEFPDLQMLRFNNEP